MPVLPLEDGLSASTDPAGSYRECSHLLDKFCVGLYGYIVWNSLPSLSQRGLSYLLFFQLQLLSQLINYSSVTLTATAVIIIFQLISVNLQRFFRLQNNVESFQTGRVFWLLPSSEINGLLNVINTRCSILIDSQLLSPTHYSLKRLNIRSQ